MNTVTFAGLRWYVDGSDLTWTRLWRPHRSPGSMGETEWLNVRTDLLDQNELHAALSER